MGFLDRLRGRRDGVRDGVGGSVGGGIGGGADTPPAEAPGGPGTGGSTSRTPAPAPGPAPAPVAVAAWTGLPPIQRATGNARTGVADAGFGGRLPTWQNPSFTGAPSPAVLNPAAGSGMLSGAFGESAQPVAGPGRPVRALPSAPPAGAAPVQRMPVAPLRAIPAATAPSAPGPTASPSTVPGAASASPAAPGHRARAPGP
ncbi:hypothetical protein ACWGIV_35905, partial [Streptomyces sp. NPDC054844]